MDYQPPMNYESPVSTHSFMERVVGACKLVRPIFDEVRRDPGAMGQAAIIVAATGFASGIGAFVGDSNQSFTIDDRTYTLGGSIFVGVLASAINIAVALIAWVIISLIYRFVALRMLGAPESGIQWQEVARPIGFASVPSVLSIFGLIPLLGPLLSLIGGIWAFAAQIVALSETFRVSKWRAFGIIVVAALLIIAVMIAVGCICVLIALGIGSAVG